MIDMHSHILPGLDDGITPTTAEGLAKLPPVEKNGVHSFGAQTHPADGNCGFIVTTREKARELSADPKIEVQIVSYGFSRVEPGFMAAAPVPAARMAVLVSFMCSHSGQAVEHGAVGRAVELEPYDILV